MTGTGDQCCCWCGAVHPAGWRHASGAAAAWAPPLDQAKWKADDGAVLDESVDS